MAGALKKTKRLEKIVKKEAKQKDPSKQSKEKEKQLQDSLSYFKELKQKSNAKKALFTSIDNELEYVSILEKKDKNQIDDLFNHTAYQKKDTSIEHENNSNLYTKVTNSSEFYKSNDDEEDPEHPKHFGLDFIPGTSKENKSKSTHYASKVNDEKDTDYIRKS